jgi:hypothetical protein
VAAVAASAVALLAGCGRTSPLDSQRTFRTPEDAAHALNAAVQQSDLTELGAIFGPDGKTLLQTADPADARRDREVFTVAMAEGWRLDDDGDAKVLVVGNEAWPFPVPLVKQGDLWRFDTAAGREEVLARRIGRNELAAIRICQTYVAAQKAYAAAGHDGKPPGLFAQRVRSDPGTHNGLYWTAAAGEQRSPLGDLVAQASPSPPASAAGNPAASAKAFHGYYFRILTAQGANATGGVKSYIDGRGDMSGGFALVAWPAEYDVTGITTFLINQEGVVHEKDLGADTAAAAARITVYDPDSSWNRLP